MTDTPIPCNRCGAATYRVVETGTRAAAMQATVEAAPYGGDPTRAPPGLTLWQQRPRAGWVCLDSGPRPGPVYLEHRHEPKGTTVSVWDDPEIQPEEGNFATFNTVGDVVIGRIIGITTKTFPNDKGGTDKVPQLALVGTDGAELTLTAGGAVLRRKLIEERPEVGDSIRVAYVGKEGRTKIYTVEVKRGGAPAPAPAPAAAGGFSDDPPF